MEFKKIPRSGGNATGGTKRLTDKERATRKAIRDIKRSAHSRGKEVEISDNQIRKLLNMPCYYCGGTSKRTYGEYNGIDRVDNNIGYTKDNCVSCCDTCNRWKGALSLPDFIDHVSRIYYLWGEG